MSAVIARADDVSNERSQRLAETDSCLIAVARVAGFYRIATDPAQLRHQLAVISR